MKRLLQGVFYIFLVLNVFTGCDPIGSINNGGDDDNGNGTGSLNFLWLVPNRFLYETEERFDREYDLQILVAENGYIREIPSDDSDITIEIIENPGLTSESSTVLTNTFYRFVLPGRYIISVSYGERSSRYSIEVRGTFVNPGDGSDFFGIIWL